MAASSDSDARSPSPPAPAPADAGSRTARRKSGRVRKEVQRLGASNGKSKRNGNADSDDDDDDDNDDSDDSPEEADDDDEFKVPTSIKTGSRKRAPPGTSPGPLPAGRAPPRAKKAAAKPTAPRKRKAAKVDEDDEDENGAGAPAAKKAAAAAKDFKIENDNGLFNAVKNPNTALQTTAEDWIESYRDEPGPAMAELVNFVLRCCGVNATIDEHQAEDENGIVENLKDIVDDFKQETDLAYPLISKSKPYKKFRDSLAQFLQKLLAASADDILFSTAFYEHFQAWVHALSSSQIRALRHTATVVVLLCVNALSTLHVQVRKEHAQAVRAKEAEEKKSRKDKARLRDMERQVKEAHERLETVEAFMDESYTSVFVNRYRDADAVIRSECISSLGAWMKLDPDHWIDGDYLRYIGWVLSDESKEARRESVRALLSLYQKDAYLGKLHHFTDRFKQQLVDMAVGEHDLAVRVQSLQVVHQIDKHGLLEDDKQRDEVAMLIYEKEPRVRAAAAAFFKNLVDEDAEELQGELDVKNKSKKGRGRKAKEVDEALSTAVEYKILAQLLVKYGKALDGPPVGDDDEGDSVDDSQHLRSSDSNGMTAGDVVPSRAGAAADGDDAGATVVVPRARVACAVDALWSTVTSLQDWEAMLEYVLRDHSAAAVAAAGSSGKGKGKGKQGRAAGGRAKHPRSGGSGEDEDEEMQDGDGDDGGAEEQLPEEVRLTEEEETLFIEVLVACLTRITTATMSKKKEQEAIDEEVANVGRALIEALPKLFSKNQAYSSRLIDILSLPRLISLELFLEGQQLSAYEALWDDVTKQLLKHTQPDLLDQAVRTLVTFLSAKDLSATNQIKLGELEETTIGALRAAAGDDVESASFSDDELHTLTACVARVAKLAAVYNISLAMEDTDDGKAASVLDILDGIFNRGRLGYKDETAMVEHAINLLGGHICWQIRAVKDETTASGKADLPTILAVSERRQSLLDRLEEYAVGGETNASEGVKQAALDVLLDIYMISHVVATPASDPDGLLADLKLVATDELQARCAGFVEAEIERYAETLREADEEEQDATQREEGSDDGASSSGSETETERSQGRSQRGKGKGKKAAAGRKGKGKQAALKKVEKRRRKTVAQVRADNAKDEAKLAANQHFLRSVVSPFLRVFHSGGFNLRHCVVLLKHWGRFSREYDEQCKLLLHDLRDEGVYSAASDIVASTVVDILKSACDVHLDSPDAPSTTTEEPLVSLGRQLSGVVAIRGAHLAIVGSLPAEDHLRLHVDALKWIVPKLAHLEETKRKDERTRAIVFFKALAHLLLGLDGRSSLKVKTTLDRLLDEHELAHAGSATGSKIWEPVRAYQRRLITAMSKDPSIRKAAATDGDKKPAAATKAPRYRDKTTPKAKTKSPASDEDDEQPEAALGADADEDDDQLAGAASDEADGAEVTATASTSASRRGASVSQSLYGSQARQKQPRPPSPSQELFGPGAGPAAKRRRTSPPVEEEQEYDAEQQASGSSAPQASASQSQARKRAREEEQGDEDDDALGATGDLGVTQTQLDDEDSGVVSSGVVGAGGAARSEREMSLESTMSLTDLKGKKRRL
ncbi:hypothetical protein JCM3775_005740 [Rhodotorula graminis]